MTSLILQWNLLSARFVRLSEIHGYLEAISMFRAIGYCSLGHVL